MLDEKDLPYINQDDKTFYEKWQEREGLDVVKGLFVDDCEQFH